MMNLLKRLNYVSGKRSLTWYLIAQLLKFMAS